MLTQAKTNGGRYVSVSLESGKELEDGTIKRYMRVDFTHFQDSEAAQIVEQEIMFNAVKDAVVTVSTAAAEGYK